MMRTIMIVYSTSSGHTEFVVDTAEKVLAGNKDIRTVRQRAEMTKPEDFAKGDILLLACGTWNTGGPEGQLQPHMYELLMNRAASLNLGGKRCAAIGLGDSRYHFTGRAAGKLTEYVQTHNGNLLLPALTITNEPFDQTKKIEAWAKEFLNAVSKIPAKQR